MSKQSEPVQLSFSDNALLAELFGERDHNLQQVERMFDVTVSTRGNTVSITGAEATRARDMLADLYRLVETGQRVGRPEIEAAYRMAGQPAPATDAIKTAKRSVYPRTVNQKRYIRSLRSKALTFGVGAAGTGKTYLAVAVAAAELRSGAIERIVLSRPAVEAGERLGFLPGDLREKIDPYLRPLHDALGDMLHHDWLARRMENGVIEIAPLGFMRGRTLSNAFVILDEAQNATTIQMKMFLTRLGEGARMAVTGDLSQIDLPPGRRSGLAEALQITAGLDDVVQVRFGDRDVIRPALVSQIVRAYEKAAARGNTEPLTTDS